MIKANNIQSNTFDIYKPLTYTSRYKIPTKKVWVKLIHVIDNIVALGTSVAVLQALTDTLKTTVGTNKGMLW